MTQPLVTIALDAGVYQKLEALRGVHETVPELLTRLVDAYEEPEKEG